jgi:hypothetical protein
MPPRCAVECVAEPRASASIATNAEHLKSVAVRATERNRNDVVDLELYGLVWYPVEAWTHVPVGRDVGARSLLLVT